MNCNCGGTCQNCVTQVQNAPVNPQFANGGKIPPTPQLSWEQYSSGQMVNPMSSPMPSVGMPTPDPSQFASAPVETPNPSEPTPSISEVDEWVFIDMSPWKILFWSIDEPIII